MKVALQPTAGRVRSPFLYFTTLSPLGFFPCNRLAQEATVEERPDNGEVAGSKRVVLVEGSEETLDLVVC